MWTRKELKEKGKKAFLFNYWKAVLVSLILVVLIGGSAGSIAGRGSRSTENSSGETSTVTTMTESVEETLTEYTGGNTKVELPAGAKAVLAVFAVLVGIVGFGSAVAVVAFLLNPFEVGCDRFFVRNLNQKAKESEIAFAFDSNYLNIVKTCFFRDLYTILWALLLIIPGIIKSYEYRMISYILADHPEMSQKEVFAKSKELMKGQKWRAFVLDLSFLGWEILSILTVRVLGVLYVTPYRNMTNAALYERLEYGNLVVEENN